MGVKTSDSEGKGYSLIPRVTKANTGYSLAPKTSKTNSGYSLAPRVTKPNTGYSLAPKASAAPASVPFDASSIFKQAAWMTPSQIALANAKKAAPSDTSNGGGGYADPSAAYRDQSAKDRARLEALYNAYAGQIAGNEAGINTNYGASANTLGGIYGGAAAATNAGYDAMRAAQTEQLKALGITGGTPSESFGAQMDAAGRYTNLGTASQALNEAQRNAAIAGNQSIVGAIRGEQRGALSDFDRMTQENIAAQQQAAASAAAANAAAQARAQAQSAKDAQYWDYKWADLDQKAKIAADNAARADRELTLKYPQ